MAKKRYISDSFWSDNWVQELDPIEKLLYLYLLTNQFVSVSWIYEINIRRIAFDTWIDKDMVEKIVRRFEEEEKIYFSGGFIIIVNFVKNQNIKTETDNLWKWIVREVEEIGSVKLKTILAHKNLIRVLQGAYKDLPIPYLTLLNLTLPNSTDESEQIQEENENVSAQVEQVYKYWNYQKTIDEKWKAHIKLTDDIKKVINTALKKYSLDDIDTAIQKYHKEIRDRREWDYKNHRFTLVEFLKREWGLRKFYNLSD